VTRDAIQHRRWRFLSLTIVPGSRRIGRGECRGGRRRGGRPWCGRPLVVWPAHPGVVGSNGLGGRHNCSMCPGTPPMAAPGACKFLRNAALVRVALTAGSYFILALFTAAGFIFHVDGTRSMRSDSHDRQQGLRSARRSISCSMAFTAIKGTRNLIRASYWNLRR